MTDEEIIKIISMYNRLIKQYNKALETSIKALSVSLKMLEPYENVFIKQELDRSKVYVRERDATED